VKVIYFVDDEQGVLDGLRRTLRDLRHEWQMAFFNSGEQALEAMTKQTPDVIVSDMRMPGMDGVELLARVRAEYPSVYRMVLTGHAEFEAISQVAKSAHEVMNKPCDSDQLREVLQNAHTR